MKVGLKITMFILGTIFFLQGVFLFSFIPISLVVSFNESSAVNFFLIPIIIFGIKLVIKGRKIGGLFFWLNEVFQWVLSGFTAGILVFILGRYQGAEFQNTFANIYFGSYLLLEPARQKIDKKLQELSARIIKNIK